MSGLSMSAGRLAFLMSPAVYVHHSQARREAFETGKAMAAHIKTDGKAHYAAEVVDQARVRVVSVDLNSGTPI